MCLQHAESAFEGYNRGGSGACLVCACFFAFFPRRKARRRAHAPPYTSSTIAQVTTSKHKKRRVKRQFTITHVGERCVDSGGESWAELSALKMKRTESTQEKILVNGCSQTKRKVFTSQFFLAFRSSCKQSVRGDTDTLFAFNILLS